MLPDCTVVEPEIIQGITFRVEQGENVMVGHCSIMDRGSGITFALIADDEGKGRAVLRDNLISYLVDVHAFIEEETGEKAALVCLGSLPNLSMSHHR